MGKHIALFGLIALLAAGLAAGFSGPSGSADSGNIGNFPYIDQMILESSRYTQPDESDPAVLADYHSRFTLAYTEAELATLGFVEMFDTADLRVWFEKDSFSLMVENKATGYFWSSRPEYQGISGASEGNKLYRNLLNSGLWIEYVRVDAEISTSAIATDSLYSLAEVRYQTTGAITEENPDHLNPYLLLADSYDKDLVETTVTAAAAESFTVHVDLKSLAIAFDVTVSLSEGELSVRIPWESVAETGARYRLLNLSVFPYFGACREDEFPGYLMIPDGVGALVRTDRKYNAYLQADFYGDDYGYGSSVIPHLSVPIYGIVHEAGANGYYVEITGGAEYSTLLAYLWGDKTRYDRIYSRFNYRDLYLTVINQAGDGNDTLREAIRPVDFSQTYHFLSGSEASYVGMASDYRDALWERGILSASEKTAGGSIPIQLSWILGDQEPSFIGTTRVTMTTLDQVASAYENFRARGLLNQQVALCGWSRDGFVNRAPYNTTVAGSKADLRDLAETLRADGNALYLADDYVWSTELSSRVSYIRDVAKNLSRLKIMATTRTLDGQITELRFLDPSRSLAFAEKDADFFADLGVGLSLDSLGYTLSSWYDGEIHERGEALALYRELAALSGDLLLSLPSDYLFQGLDGYLDMPITNSQFDYYTDLVPILPIILKGSVSAYTPFLNFNALGDDRILMMIDFGLNPSYILTWKETYEMRYTPSSVFYTTTLSAYEDEIVSTYQTLNAALGPVLGEKIADRTVLSTGFVRTTYENGVAIYVNYGSTEKTAGAVTVPARGFEVILP